MAARTLVALGNFRAERRATVETAAQQAGFLLDCVEKADEALSRLREPPAAVLLDMMTPGAERVCHSVRGAEALFGVPVIAITRKITDLSFSNAFRWGADDVLTLSSVEPLIARLSVLGETRQPEDTSGRGQAVICDTDVSRAQILSRVLATAGFNVRHAKDLTAARFYLTRSEASLVVFSTEIGNAKQMIAEAQSRPERPNLIILCRPTEVEVTSAQLKDLPGVATIATSQPPENILYLANELEETARADSRADARALYGTVVAFRPAGDDIDDYGFSYNVSASGLYVRTLAPCVANEVWVELRPPRSSRRIRLVCSVVWRRAFGLTGKETAPPGFGLQIMDAVTTDLEAWEEGFAHAIVDHRRSFSVPPRVSKPPEAATTAGAAADGKPASQETSQRPTRPATVDDLTDDAELVSIEPGPIQRKKPAFAATLPAAMESALANKAATSPESQETASAAPTRKATTVEELRKVETLPPAFVESIPAGARDSLPGNAKPGAVAKAAVARLEDEPHTPLAFPPPPPAGSGPEQARQPVHQTRHAATLVGGVTAPAPQAPAPQAPRAPVAQAPVPQAPTQPVTLEPSDAKSVEPTPLSESQRGEAALEGQSLPERDYPGDADAADLEVPSSRITGTAAFVAISVGVALGMLLWWFNQRTDTDRSGAAVTRAAVPSSVATLTSAESTTSDPRPSTPGTEQHGETRALSSGQNNGAAGTSSTKTPASAPTDATSLPAKSAYLYVDSPTDANVYVHGQLAGRTNAWVQTSCGTRFIRLGLEAGKWLSKGSVSIVKCQATNKVSIVPDSE